MRVVGAHHNHQMMGVEELAHCPQKGEGHLSGWQVEEELLHLVVMEVVMGMMTMEGVIGHLPPRRNKGNGSEGGGNGDGSGGDDSPPLSDQGQP